MRFTRNECILGVQLFGTRHFAEISHGQQGQVKFVEGCHDTGEFRLILDGALNDGYFDTGIRHANRNTHCP